MAARFDALNRLWDSARESSHDFRNSTDIFPVFDIEKMSRSLDLQERGAANGTLNKPVKSSRALDEVEQQIASKVEEEKRASYKILEEQFHTFDDRLRNLDFESQFGLIRQANATSLTDFKAEATSGVDELHGKRRDLKVAEDELASFKSKHRLDRAAKVSSGAAWFFKIALLVFILLLETALNGSFLSIGNEGGMVGGVTIAFSYALLNVVSALLLAFFVVRRIIHRSFFAKMIGLIGLCVYVSLACAINLTIAHYREVSAETFTGVGKEVMRRLISTPFSFNEIDSWALFGLGLVFSIFAFIDGCTMVDPYPGFTGVQKRLAVSRDDYIDTKKDLIDELRDVRDEHNEKVETIIKSLSARRQDFQSIISHRSRLSAQFMEHQNQLERAANSLLTIYREANRQTRTEPEPKYFTAAYKVERLNPMQHVSEEWNDKDLAERIAKAQSELSDQMAKIGVEFETAIDRYHKLDNLFPEVVNGPAQQAA